MSAWIDDDMPPQSPKLDEQLWPIQSALVILAGFAVGIIIPNSDFEDARLLFNGYTQILIVAIITAMFLAATFRLRPGVRRTIQLSLLLCLVLHTGMVCSFYWVKLPIIQASDSSGGDESAEPDENIAPDYNAAQAEDPDAQQDFQKPVETKVKPENVQSTKIEPRERERPNAVPLTQKTPPADITPMGLGGSVSSGGALEMHRAEAAAADKAKIPDAVAMARQPNDKLANDNDLPKPDVEMPQMPKAKPADDKTGLHEEVLQPHAGDLIKPFVPAFAANKTNPTAHPATVHRASIDDSGPDNNLVAQLPSQGLPQAAKDRGEAGGSDKALQTPASLSRSDRDGLNVPSSIIPDIGAPGTSPALAGATAGSSQKNASDVAVQGFNGSHAPLGPSVAARGTQEYASGGKLIASRMGSSETRGKDRPSVTSWSTDDPSALRAGSENSLLAQGAAVSNAAARRAIASQLKDGGKDLTPGESATPKRSQSPAGIDLPVASIPTDSPGLPGAGGVSPIPGGSTSKLMIGPPSVGRTSDAVAMRTSGGPVTADDLSSSTSSQPSTQSGIPSGIGRAQASVNAGVRDPSNSLQRAQTNNITPDTTAEMVAGQTGTALAPPPARPSDSQSPAATLTGPPAGDLGSGRFSGPSQRIGTPSTSRSDLSQIGGLASIMTPQTTGPAAHRAGQADGDLNQIIAGSGAGRGGIGRNTNGLGLDGTIREPTEFYRRRTNMRHGLGSGTGDGSGFTEPAVENGLDFYTHIQFPDGHWSLDKLPETVHLESPGLGSMSADSAATGLALLGYLGAGYTHLDEKHRDDVRRGLEWLIKHQKPDGDLFTGGADATHFYSHGIAAMALCEAYGMTQDPDLREPAQKAVQFIVNSQDPQMGGWRYVANQGSDTSVTGWQLMALKSAQMAGLEVPDETIRKIGGWLDRAQGTPPGSYVYNPWNLDTPEQREGRVASPTMTSESMLMRMYMGKRRDDPQLVQGAEYIMAHLPEVGTREEPTRDCYYWYYATQAMYQMQGDYWKTWNSRVGPLVKAGQVTNGPLKGSWHPTQPVPDRWGSAGGRLYVTSMHLLMLEVYYRHLPLFQELSK